MGIDVERFAGLIAVIEGKRLRRVLEAGWIFFIGSRAETEIILHSKFARIMSLLLK